MKKPRIGEPWKCINLDDEGEADVCGYLEMEAKP